MADPDLSPNRLVTSEYAATSWAAPLVSGAAALYLSAHPTASPAEVRAWLVDNATKGVMRGNLHGSPNRLLFTGGPLSGIPSQFVLAHCGCPSGKQVLGKAGSDTTPPSPSHLWRVADLRPSSRSGRQWLATDHIDPLAEHAQPDGERDQEHAEDNGVATDQPGQRQRAGAWLLCQRQRVADTDAYGAARSQKRRPSVLDRLDAALFAFAGLSTIWLAYLLVREGVRPGWQMLLLVVFWVLLTYLLLPRLHRILTRIYVPGYFIGRARTSDGLLGDPINLALLGHEAQVHRVMTRAGWSSGRRPDSASGLEMIRSTLRRRSYPRGTGQPTAAVRPAAGLRLPAGGGRQPVEAAPRPVLAGSGGLDAPRWLRRGLAGGRHLRPQRRVVPVHPADHPQDRREHRHRTRLHHEHDHRRRAPRWRSR